MLTWPHAQSDWAPWLAEVNHVFVDIAKAIAMYEKVLISCFNIAHREVISKQLQAAQANLSNILLYIAPSDDTWVRDHGPITVLENSQPRLLDFSFNAWGGKYSASRDNQLTQILHEQGAFGKTPLKTIELILEGGSIETDGCGTLLTTSQCLLSATRNTHLDRLALTLRLQQLLGIEQILWLEDGALAGDDTDSHIDTLARFTDAHTICYMACEDSRDNHYKPLQKMAEQLSDFKNTRGVHYQLIPLPWPKAYYNQQGKRLPATYANFLIINEAVLVPVYNDPADGEALDHIQSCFPQRKVIPIPCRTLIEQYGSLHCVTMQLPDGVL
jgi:agmatine deiminase